jgi:biopolymer transport protein ExbD
LTNIEIGKEKTMNPQQQHEYDVAIQNGHQHFYEHIPVFKSEAIDLLNAIKKKKPELIVVGGSRQRGHHTSNGLVYTYRELELAYANLPEQVVGAIGFDGEVYTVNSRLIENARFSAWSSYE